MSLTKRVRRKQEKQVSVNQLSHKHFPGYTVLKDKLGYFLYANVTKEGNLYPTQYVVGRTDPAAKGLKKGYRNTKRDCSKHICGDNREVQNEEKLNCNINTENRRENCNNLRKRKLGSPHGRHLAPRFGTVKNLVVLMRFSDHVGRVLPTREDVDVLMNSEEVPCPNDLCHTGSLKNVYLQNSYGQLRIESTVADWVTLPGTEAYYAANTSG